MTQDVSESSESGLDTLSSSSEQEELQMEYAELSKRILVQQQLTAGSLTLVQVLT